MISAILMITSLKWSVRVWTGICNLRRRDHGFSCSHFIDSVDFHLDKMTPYKKVNNLMLKPGHLLKS